MLAAVALILPLYATLTTPSSLAAMNHLPRAIYVTLRFDNIHTGPGYTQATIFSGVGFLVMLAAGIQWGSAAIAGAQEDGTWARMRQRGVGRVQYCLRPALRFLSV